MQFTEPTESLKQYEELKKNQNPSGHKLALRLMEAAAELGQRKKTSSLPQLISGNGSMRRRIYMPLRWRKSRATVTPSSRQA